METMGRKRRNDCERLAVKFKKLLLMTNKGQLLAWRRVAGK